MTVHTDGKAYQCDQCSKYLSDPWSLKQHLRIHSGERPFPCSQCDKRFSSSSHFNKHFGNRGVKPYSCADSDVSFTHRGSLLHHNRSFHGNMPYKCNQCGKGFTTPRGQKRHKCDSENPKTSASVVVVAVL